jgi:hypothetical protein
MSKNTKFRRFDVSAQHPKTSTLEIMSFPRQRSVFSGVGPLFITPEEQAAADKAAADRTALIDEVANKVTEKIKLPDFEKRLGGISKAVHDVTEAITKLKPKEDDEEKKKEAVTLSSLRTEVQQERTKREEAETNSKRKVAKVAYAEELKKTGINATVARDLADGYVAKNLAKIILGEDDAVFYRESEETDAVGIGSVVAEWLKTDHGKAYIPPKGTTSKGLEKESTGGVSIQGWMPKTKREAREDPDKLHEFLKTNKAAYEALPEK